MSQLAHRRVLLKLSGEALMGAEDYGIDPRDVQGADGRGRRARPTGGGPGRQRAQDESQHQ